MIDDHALNFWGWKQIREYISINCDQRFWEEQKLYPLQEYFREKVKGTIYDFRNPDNAATEDDLDMFLSKRFIRYLNSLN